MPQLAAILLILIDSSSCIKHRIGFAFHNNAFKISFISTREQHNSVAPPSSSSLLFAQPSQPLLRRRTFLSSTTADGDVLDSTISEVIGDDNTSCEPDISISHTTHISNNEHLDNNNTELEHDDAYYDQLFDTLTENSKSKHNSNDEEVEDDDEEGEEIKLIDFIEQTVGIQNPAGGEDISKEVKKKRGRDKPKEKDTVTFTVQGNEKVFEVGDDDKRKEIDDNKEEDIPPEDSTEEDEEHDHSDIAFVFPSSIDIKSSPKTSSEVNVCTTASIMEEQPPPSVNEKKEAPYNVVCTHITADFDTLASAIGLAKLWSNGIYDEAIDIKEKDNPVYGPLPTYVVLPRGAHPDVQRFLSLHKHLFPIRSLKSLPGFTDNDLKKGNNNNNNNKGGGGNGNGNTNPREGLQRVGLVDAQRRDRLGPADVLLPHAKLGVTIVDHHVDAESDIQETNNYVVENVGSVSTMIAERMRYTGVEITEAEATILALGIHSDTGSLVYDSTVCLFSCVLCMFPHSINLHPFHFAAYPPCRLQKTQVC